MSYFIEDLDGNTVQSGSITGSGDGTDNQILIAPEPAFKDDYLYTFKIKIIQ